MKLCEHLCSLSVHPSRIPYYILSPNTRFHIYSMRRYLCECSHLEGRIMLVPRVCLSSNFVQLQGETIHLVQFYGWRSILEVKDAFIKGCPVITLLFPLHWNCMMRTCIVSPCSSLPHLTTRQLYSVLYHCLVPSTRSLSKVKYDLSKLPHHLRYLPLAGVVYYIQVSSDKVKVSVKGQIKVIFESSCGGIRPSDNLKTCYAHKIISTTFPHDFSTWKLP